MKSMPIGLHHLAGRFKSMRIFCWRMVLFALLYGCSHPDYSVALPQGYELVRGNDVDIFITSAAHSIVIDGTIVRYAVVVNRYVVGQQDTTEVKRKEPKGFSVGKGGWFLLDTQTRTVQTELSESDWKEKVIQLSAGKIPELTVPEGIRESLVHSE